MLYLEFDCSNATAVSGMTAGASSSLDKKKSSVWNDTETTISVNWSEGGEIKVNKKFFLSIVPRALSNILTFRFAQDPATKLDLATIIDVASRFPYLVEFSTQPTSAILTKYSSLRSFVSENTKLIAKVGKGRGYMIRDYSLCHLYTNDLSSVYMTYKTLWTKISDMMKHIGDLTKVRFHAHEHHHGEIFVDFHHHSKSCQ